MSLQRLRARATLAQARLGAGDAAGALAAATSLVADLDASKSGTNATARATAEVAALAAARLGDRAAAAAWLARADGLGAAFPSAVERADSALRRAQVLAALGRAAEARAAAQSALPDLQGQSPASPRPALARRLAEG
jgi:hypothetical protein